MSPKSIFKPLMVTALVALMSLAGWCFYLWQWLHTDISLQAYSVEQRVLQVRPGDSVSRVLRRFERNYGMEHRRVAKIYARLTQLTTIKKGEYQLPEQISPHQLLVTLNDGDVIQHAITLVEGTTAAEAITLVRANSKLQQLTAEWSAQELRQKLGVPEESLEGWLFPDTYHFTRGSSDLSLLLRAVQRTKAVLREEWEKRAHGLPYETPYEALIMASIIEKETGLAEEREEIAGVFVRRLQLGMRLQTDPTVIYGLGGAYDGNLTRQHLRQETAYNTYRIAGLPPTPIALAGREAIYAALHPAPGKALYFVARGDGSHLFSETLEQHEAAVEKYQRNRVKNYRSSPAP